MVLFGAFSGLLTVFLVASLGYYLAKKGYFSAEITAALPRFITTIALPPYMFRSVTTSFERDQLLQLLYGGIIPFLSIFLIFFLAMALAAVLRVRTGRRGVFRTAVATANTVNMGIPVNIALFGEAALPYVLLYLFANSVFFWTIGNYSIASDGPEGRNAKFFSRDTVRHLLSPPLIGFLCGIILVLLDLHLPVFLDRALKYVGDMTIALALFYLGIILSSISIRECKPDRDVTLVILGRLVLSPLTVFLLSMFIDIPPLMRNVFIIQSSLPVMVNAAIITGHYKGDLGFAALAVSLTTFLCMFTVPVYMLLIQML